MPDRAARLTSAVAAVAGVEGVSMAPSALAEDLAQMLDVYGDDFEAAVGSATRAMRDVVAGRVTPARLKYELSHVLSYHFQSRRLQGQRADLRLAYVPAPDGI